MNKEKLAQEDTALSPTQAMRTWREQITRILLRAFLIVGLLAVIMASIEAYVDGIPWRILIFIGLYLVLCLVAFLPRISYRWQILVLILILVGFGIYNLLGFANNADSFLFLAAVPFLAALFFEQRGGGIAIGVVVLALVVVTILFSTGQVVVYNTTPVRSADWQGWATTAVLFVMISLAIVFAQSYMADRLFNALDKSYTLNQTLRDERAGLENRVEQRTIELTQERAQLQAVAEIARDAAALHDVDRLVDTAVQLVSERFGFYHVGIFMLDETGLYAILKAASSAGGLEMLAQGHLLQVGQEGVVGYVAEQAEPRIAMDVGQDAVFFTNPYLPDTRSELALPLMASGSIIGVLDVQSSLPEAFVDQDVSTLQMLSDQLALSISNIRLLSQSEARLAAEQRALGELTGGRWQDLLRDRSDLVQQYDPHGLLAEQRADRAKMQEVIDTDEHKLESQSSTAALVVPVKVTGGQVVGVVNALKPSESGQWREEERELIESLVGQLGVALESAQLYQDTQRREAEQRLVSEITARFRRSLLVDTVLQTAVREIGDALDLAHVEVRMLNQTGQSGTISEETT